MYKYMEMRPERKQQGKDQNLEEANTGPEDDESNVDVEMEKFADEEMDREMARMVQGAPGGMPDSDDEDILPIDVRFLKNGARLKMPSEIQPPIL